jgi:hypothetical protein
LLASATITLDAVAEEVSTLHVRGLVGPVVGKRDDVVEHGRLRVWHRSGAVDTSTAELACPVVALEDGSAVDWGDERLPFQGSAAILGCSSADAL